MKSQKIRIKDKIIFNLLLLMPLIASTSSLATPHLNYEFQTGYECIASGILLTFATRGVAPFQYGCGQIEQTPYVRGASNQVTGKSFGNPSGAGSLQMAWQTWARGGHYARNDFKATSHITGGLNFNLVGISDPELTWLWVDYKSYLPHPAQGNLFGLAAFHEIRGQMFGNIQSDTTIDNLPMQGALLTSQSSRGGARFGQKHIHYGYAGDIEKIGNQFKIDYLVISPETCAEVNQPQIVDSDTYPKFVKALIRQVCHPLETSAHLRGAQAYITAYELENQASNLNTPFLAKVARVRLNRFWNVLKISFSKDLTFQAKLMNSTSKWILGQDRSGVNGSLQNIRLNFLDQNHRDQSIQELISSMNASPFSVSPLGPETAEDLEQISDYLNGTKRVQLDDLDEAILYTISVGTDLKYEASILGIEADLIKALGRN